MARRKSKRKNNRKKPDFNLIDGAVAVILANTVSKNVTGLGTYDFLTAGTALNPNRGISGWGATGDVHRNMVTLKELTQMRQTSGQSIPSALMGNIQANWLPLTISVIAIPVVAKVAKKALRKPLLTPVNRLLKQTGLGVKV